MATFQAKVGWKMPRNRENKITVPFRSVSTRREIENSQKIGKKFKKLKNTIVGSFQAKIGWKKPRKRKNKNYRSVPFRSCTTCNRKFQKKGKKIQKISLWLHFKAI